MMRIGLLLVCAAGALCSCVAMGQGRVLDRARADFPACGEPEIVRSVGFRYYTEVCGETVAYTLHESGAITREDGVGTAAARPGAAPADQAAHGGDTIHWGM